MLTTTSGLRTRKRCRSGSQSTVFCGKRRKRLGFSHTAISFRRLSAVSLLKGSEPIASSRARAEVSASSAFAADKRLGMSHPPAAAAHTASHPRRSSLVPGSRASLLQPPHRPPHSPAATFACNDPARCAGPREYSAAYWAARQKNRGKAGTLATAIAQRMGDASGNLPLGDVLASA